jgi:hypothetical protein
MRRRSCRFAVQQCGVTASARAIHFRRKVKFLLHILQIGHMENACLEALEASPNIGAASSASKSHRRRAERTCRLLEGQA